MAEVLRHKNGSVEIEPAADGRLRLRVRMADPGALVTGPEWTTAYPLELIAAILEVKGPAWLCDELRRDEDPAYVENDFRHDVLGFVDPGDFRARKVLDFGCGCGASIAVLSRLAAGVQITGVDLDAASLKIARRRVEHYGLTDTQLLLSPDPQNLPQSIGDFDFILFSAVFEHLLPDERLSLLPKVWSCLRPGGVLFLNQTPHRFFPLEGHTTGLPLINYLPDRLAHALAGRFCRRAARGKSWPELLRAGIRGGTPGEVLDILRSTGERPENLMPAKNGLCDHLDLWDESSRVRHGGLGHCLKMSAARLLRAVTGHTVVPNISMAIRKGTCQDEPGS